MVLQVRFCSNRIWSWGRKEVRQPHRHSLVSQDLTLKWEVSWTNLGVREWSRG